MVGIPDYHVLTCLSLNSWILHFHSALMHAFKHATDRIAPNIVKKKCIIIIFGKVTKKKVNRSKNKSRQTPVYTRSQYRIIRKKKKEEEVEMKLKEKT